MHLGEVGDDVGHHLHQLHQQDVNVGYEADGSLQFARNIHLGNESVGGLKRSSTLDLLRCNITYEVAKESDQKCDDSSEQRNRRIEEAAQRDPETRDQHKLQPDPEKAFREI